MSFLTIFLLSIFTIYVIFRFFGRTILRFLVSRLMKRMVQDAEQKAKAYQQNYNNDPYHENLYTEDEVKISIPKQKSGQEVQVDEIVEDIEFEDQR